MSPIKSLFKSIQHSSHTSDLADKLGEVPLDSLLADGAIKDIPIIGTAITLLRAGNDIAAYFFTKKILFFLNEIESVSEDERNKFIENEFNEEDKSENVGEITLMLLDKIDYPILAKMLGKAFALYMKKAITRQEFDIYSYIIKNLNSYLIQQIVYCFQFENVMSLNAPAAIQLSVFGLIKTKIPAVINNSDEITQRYEKTEFGRVFYERIIETVIETI